MDKSPFRTDLLQGKVALITGTKKNELKSSYLPKVEALELILGLLVYLRDMEDHWH
jgi:hypothetical protein